MIVTHGSQCSITKMESCSEFADPPHLLVFHSPYIKQARGSDYASVHR